MGGNEYGESGHLSIFTLLKHLMMLFEVAIFSGLHFYTLPKSLIACRAMQLRFFKVKTLLNNAFNHSLTKKKNTNKHQWLMAGWSTDWLLNFSVLDNWTDQFYEFVTVNAEAIFVNLAVLVSNWRSSQIGYKLRSLFPLPLGVSGDSGRNLSCHGQRFSHPYKCMRASVNWSRP